MNWDHGNRAPRERIANSRTSKRIPMTDLRATTKYGPCRCGTLRLRPHPQDLHFASCKHGQHNHSMIGLEYR